MTIKQQSLFNRLILAQAYVWIKQVSEEGAHMPDIAYKIRTAGHNSFVINRFDSKERKIIESIANDQRVKEISEVQTSPVIQALELMKIWVEDIPKNLRTNINIKDDKLIPGKRAYLTHMIKLKRLDKEDHAFKRDIIEDSSQQTVLWYNACKDIISKAEL